MQFTGPQGAPFFRYWPVRCLRSSFTNSQFPLGQVIATFAFLQVERLFLFGWGNYQVGVVGAFAGLW